MKTTNNKNSTRSGPAANPKKGRANQDSISSRAYTTSKKTSGDLVSQLIQIKSNRLKESKTLIGLFSSIGLCLSLLFVIGAFEYSFPEKQSNVEIDESRLQFEDLLEIPQTQQIKKPPAVMQAPKIIEVKDEEIIEEIEINLDIEMTEDTRIEEVVITAEATIMPEEKADEIFTIVEEQPSPVGGMKAFYSFIANNMHYPPKAARMGISGRVFVEFIVEKDGSLADAKVVKGIGAGCDEEALRVLAIAPNWKPGKQRGNPVRVRMVMPIMFKLVNA